jgi:lysophospholipase L1-like esterase
MVVCIGDSITAGQHLADGELPWPALIEGHDVVAAGVPSDTTRLGLERFPTDVQAREPEAVVIQFGHNDCNRWETDRGLPRVSEAAFAANLAEMVARCLAFGAVPFLCTLTPSMRSTQHAEDVERYDRILRERAADDFVELIDVRELFGQDARLLLADGLHLSPAGHHIYAGAVQRTLDARGPR